MKIREFNFRGYRWLLTVFVDEQAKLFLHCFDDDRDSLSTAYTRCC